MKQPEFWYVKNYYKVPVYKDQRVVMDGKPGTVKGDGGQYVQVLFDGDKHALPVHPTWRMTYFNPDGTVAAQYGD